MTEFSRLQREREPDDENRPRRIILVDRDPAQLHDLVVQLNSFGYLAEPVSALGDLPLALDAEPETPAGRPLALVVDLIKPDGGPVTAADMAAIKPDGRALPPVIFNCERSDLPARLLSVRAGGHSYLTRPIDVARLVDLLDDLVSGPAEEPFRVLVVDDSPLLAAYLTSILTRAGIEVRATTDPFQVLPLIAEFQPELLLADLQMPDVSGPELATVIRQQPAYVSMPIIFLSGESDQGVQLAAIKGGGDDFLTKPIAPEYLVAALTSRLERARALRRQLTNDGLTGLLNHTAMADRLKLEVERAQRCNTPLAVAMVDLDHFKLVNDSYGHAAGDRVLKNLARMLQQRLRRSDHIGRYGGEEFMLILVGADGPAAGRVLDELREQFAQLIHQHDHANWSSTFSAGVAAFPSYTDPAGLLKSADAALYQAKRSGRNRIVLF